MRYENLKLQDDVRDLLGMTDPILNAAHVHMFKCEENPDADYVGIVIGASRDSASAYRFNQIALDALIIELMELANTMPKPDRSN